MSKVKRVLVEAANGMMVSVPEDRLESWQKRQAEIKADREAGREPTLSPETEAMIERMVSQRFGSKEQAQKQKG